MKTKILIISDEVESAMAWGQHLGKMGLRALPISIQDPVLDIVALESPDLIIIEDFKRVMEDLEICRQLRAQTMAPILLLTTNLSESFRLESGRAGVDDTLLFSATPHIFQSRVKAWLRQIDSGPVAAPDSEKVEFSIPEPKKRELQTDGSLA